jgi:pilus assembly protein CpaB
MGKRSNLIVTLGLAVFIVGAAATYLVVRSGDDGGGASSSANRVPVLVAEKPIPAGTTGTAVVTQGLIKTRNVDANAKPATAITDASQLAGKTVTLGVAEGQILTLDQFQQAQTRIGTLNIPDGKTALALQLNNVPGVAGFAGAGDKIDIYGISKEPVTNVARVRRVMSGVEVLKVNGTTLVPTQGQPGGPGLVFLVAVTPEQAERLVYLTSIDQMYFALMPKANGPGGGTPGTDAKTVLNPI